MNSILLLVDYRGAFYSSVDTQKTLHSMNIERIGSHFQKLGYALDVKRFSDVDLRQNFGCVSVLYTSSEDEGLIYKSFIEDVVLALEEAGASLLPKFKYLRAHHNKSMMEALRYQLFPEEADLLDTRCFGTYEELAQTDHGETWPKVLKSADGAGSVGVWKAETRAELLKVARTHSRSSSVKTALREYRSRLLWNGYVNRSLNRSKFVVQNLIPGLTGDFKVLCYGDRYYLLHRQNRPGDFRASGSGILSFEVPLDVDLSALLDYAKTVFETLRTPVASLDIAFDGNKFRLIEFQCLNFGTVTAERSQQFYAIVDGEWKTVAETCDLEKVFCEAVVAYVAKDRAKVAA